MSLPYCTCVILGNSGWRITAYCIFHEPDTGLFWQLKREQDAADR